MMKYSIFVMLFMGLFLWGCAQEELIMEHEDVQKVYTIRLKFDGDIQAGESPMARAETESRDLYGIQVYKNGEYFAVGMFDKVDDITINLLAGGNYTFKCTGIKDGKDKLCYSPSYGYGEYDLNMKNNPFWCYGSGELWGNCNSFYYTTSSSNSLGNLNTSYICDLSGTERKCTEIDRFYGEVHNYIPGVNGVVNLELKRVSFGIKVKVSNITDGDVSVKCYNDYNTFIDVSELTSNYESEGTLFSMENVYDAWQYSSNYLEKITMFVNWNRGVGVSQNWFKTIQVKRNVMNTIRIKLGADDNDIGVGVIPEGGEMENEDEEIPLG